MKGAIAFVLAAGMIFSARVASAQVHWDLGVQAGAMKRVLTSQPRGASDASIGPYAEVRAHVAVLPLIRVGLYLSHDISPVEGIAARQITSGGLRFKVTSPWPEPTDSFKASVFAGFGYSRLYAPSYHVAIPLPNSTSKTDAVVDGALGGFFEVPVGVQAAFRLRKPFWLTGEVGARLGFGHSGDFYDPRHGSAPNQPALFFERLGYDSWAFYAALGLQWDM